MEKNQEKLVGNKSKKQAKNLLIKTGRGNRLKGKKFGRKAENHYLKKIKKRKNTEKMDEKGKKEFRKKHKNEENKCKN